MSHSVPPTVGPCLDRLASLFFSTIIVVFFCSLLLTETETSVAIVEEDVVGDWDTTISKTSDRRHF
jgi:hypothetical protein